MNTDRETRPTYTLTDLNNFIERTEKQFSSSTVQIVFYGGEPTLNFGFIEEVIDYLSNNLPLSCHFTLHTNGLLLQKAHQTLLKKINLIIISINYEKIPNVGLASSYFSRIVEGIRKVRHTYPVPLLARLTITERCSLYTNVMQISCFFDYIYWQIQNCQEFVSFPELKQNYHYELELLIDNWYQYFLRGQILQYVPFVSMVSEIIQPTTLQVHCGYQSRMINIQTNGECFSCPEATSDQYFLIGNIYNGIEFDKNKIVLMNDCGDCEYFLLCRGRCGRMHQVLSEDRIKEYCLLNEPMFSFFSKNREQILATVQNHPEYLKELSDPIYLYTERIP